ncbi:MAG: hypothetical protein ACOZE5_16970 [Verrucomicrobiota bacterium]
MTTVELPLPDPVAAQFYSAAEKLNAEYGLQKRPITADTLMAFALARIEPEELCAQFDLTLRAITGCDVPALPAKAGLPNPVLA